MEGGVADVRLTRADKLNALDAAMFQALVATGRTLCCDASLRAVVISGEGRAFCAGLDFPSFQGGASAVDLFERSDESPANLAQRPPWILKEIPVPVIAAVHGYAFGGGLQIALGADVRIVAPDAQLSVMEIKWGLVPDMAGTQLLRDLVRLDVAKELTYTGRRVSGTEAVALGLATRTAADPHAEAMALAREIATRSPDAIRAGKALLDASVRCGSEEGLLLEEKMQRGLLGSPNQIEAVKANFEKRAPHFVDPEERD
jgi:enoyl-CoA hydratase/carnithine racemase